MPFLFAYTRPLHEHMQTNTPFLALRIISFCILWCGLFCTVLGYLCAHDKEEYCICPGVQTAKWVPI